MKKTFLYAIALILMTSCCLAGILAYSLFSPAVTQPGGYVYYLKPASSKKMVVDELTQQNIVQHPTALAIYMYLRANTHLKTGEYLFPKGASLISIWHQITTGTGLYYRPFTIIPGWSFHQLRDALLHAEEIKHLSAPMDEKQIMAHMGSPELAAEGQFYPETYYYTRGNNDLTILKRAFTLMQTRLKEAWDHRAANLPYKSEYEALTAASMIEKEAYLNQERPIIAGVIINRLRKDMLLQIDPTVIYGMGESYTGKIHKEDLQKDTAYNTYVHKGLPPTPIAMPSYPSIEAALHPQQHDYYYYVAKGDGSHHFSKSLQEHNKAVDDSLKQKTNFFNHSKVENYIQQKLTRIVVPI